jgi:hypothetical protein
LLPFIVIRQRNNPVKRPIVSTASTAEDIDQLKTGDTNHRIKLRQRIFLFAQVPANASDYHLEAHFKITGNRATKRVNAHVKKLSAKNKYLAIF